eukprot:CAMPEP_0197461670 /NCGR_PEP_ID=MMETSP1175-20131217/57149_1 /TAXON_ID=1003142 /ORGANISM="Triceratium dubium, Strain CCMP147" /LENGTH=64 /DNA_ID=CAMNT_0042997005 /DNA_START=95 /DNA_END=285 /DNA_ORIENTATION=-
MSQTASSALDVMVNGAHHSSQAPHEYEVQDWERSLGGTSAKRMQNVGKHNLGFLARREGEVKSG